MSSSIMFGSGMPFLFGVHLATLDIAIPVCNAIQTATLKVCSVIQQMGLIHVIPAAEAH